MTFETVKNHECWKILSTFKLLSLRDVWYDDVLQVSLHCILVRPVVWGVCDVPFWCAALTMAVLTTARAERKAQTYACSCWSRSPRATGLPRFFAGKAWTCRASGLFSMSSALTVLFSFSVSSYFLFRPLTVLSLSGFVTVVCQLNFFTAAAVPFSAAYLPISNRSSCVKR